MTQRHVASTVELPDVGQHLIAVLSDTHGRPHPALFPLLRKHRPQLILHAGDVGEIELIEELEKITTTVYIRGNVDPTGPLWPDTCSLRIGFGSGKKLDLLLIHFAVTQVRLTRDALNLLHQHPAQVVIFGHSHLPFLGTEGKVCLFNPGSAGPPRWGLPTTLGLIQNTADRLTFRHLDLRTGEKWRPDQNHQGDAR